MRVLARARAVRVQIPLIVQQTLAMAPSPSPTEPKASLRATALSEQQVVQHIQHLKELLRINQMQLAAGMGAAGLQRSNTQQHIPVSPSNMNPLSFVGMQAFAPIPVKALPYAHNVHSVPPFSHDADGTRYSEQTIVAVKPDPVSPVASPFGYVRRQA